MTNMTFLVLSPQQSPYSLSLKKEQHDEESRSMSDISREDEQEKSKLESVSRVLFRVCGSVVRVV